MSGNTSWILIGLLLGGNCLAADSVAERSTFDTVVSWRNDLRQAAAEAESTSKLLLVMHLSGNLAKSEFT